MAMISAERCPSCNKNGKVIGYSKTEDVYACVGCGLCFLKASFRPTSSNDNHWYADMADLTPTQIQTFFSAMANAYTRQIRVLEKMTAGRNILDLGCGVGIFIAVAKKCGWFVFGTEESEHAVAFAKKNFGIDYTENIDTLRCGVDVVRLSQVLEHVPEPLGLVKKVFELLKPGGVFVVMVPNREPLVETIVNRLRGLFNKKPRLLGAIYPDMHVLGFSSGSLKKLVERAGFKTESVFNVGMGNPTYYPMFYDGLLSIAKPKNFSSFIKFHLPMILANLGCPFGKGSIVVGYFRKPI